MRVSACSTSSHTIPFCASSKNPSRFSSSEPIQFLPGRASVRWKRLDTFCIPKLRFCRSSYGVEISPWDQKPYDLSTTGRKVYLDELDVATFLDPPKELIPLDPSSYNPATYLWKKISDIPEDRRHRLLRLLKPRHVSRMWEVAGTCYGDPKLVKQSSSSMLSLGNGGETDPLEFWNCQTNKVPISLGWMKNFNKLLFRAKDGSTCGRMFAGGFVLQRIGNSRYPCYFRVSNLKEIMPTEQPFDLAYEFEEGLLDALLIPEGFPAPAQHPWPLNDQVVVYIRHAGPGVMVGQAWQEGKILDQVPKKLCEEILLVKDYYVVYSDES